MKRKTKPLGKHFTAGQKVCPRVIVCRTIDRRLRKEQEHYPNSLNADWLFLMREIRLCHVRQQHLLTHQETSMNINEHKVHPAVTFTSQQSLEINMKSCVLTLTCVRANVSSEQPGPGEGLAAGGAHTGKSV